MWDVVERIGQGIALVAGAGALCVAVALGVGVWVRRGHRAPLKRAALFVLEFLYLPLKLLFARLPGSPSLDGVMVALRNRANHGRFLRSRRRILLAPTCLRHIECPAPSTQRGVQCRECGLCKVGEIRAAARRLGYSVFILTGSAFIPQLVAEERPEGALLVACPYECNKVMMAIGRRLATYAVPLDRDGCVETDVNLAGVRDALKLGLDAATEP